MVSITVQDVSPTDLGFLRFLVATPIMLLVLFLRKKKICIPVRELPSLAVLGLTGVTFLYIFQFIGIQYTTASTASVLINTNIVFIAILSSLFLKEVFLFKKTAGIVISFLGVAVVIGAQVINENIAFSNIFFIGCLLVLLSAFCWAIYSIVGKRLLAKYDPFTITLYAFVLGTLFFLPVVLPNIFTVISKISFNSYKISL